MNSPLVTILLPVYNGEKTIKATLESLLNQTFTDFELLIGIDGTTDASKALALSFNDSRIKIIEHPKNLGLANNLNKIIKHASPNSHYFAMAEQDDIYVPERLEWQIDVMQKYEEVGLVSGIAEFENENGNTLFPGILVNKKQYPEGEDMFRYLYINQMKVLNTCMLWRKSIHTKHNLSFRDTYGNFNVDWNFMLRFSLISKIHGIHKKLVSMNRYTERMSVTTEKKKQYAASKKLIDIESTIVITAGKKIPRSISKKITFPQKHIGYLNGDKELAEAYQIATVFVSSSIQDSGPMMINESIMCGTPVVSFKMGVAEDLVVNGETGHIAELKSFEGLAYGISKILNLDYIDYKEMREKCRKLAFTKCRTDIQTKKFISLLSE